MLEGLKGQRPGPETRRREVMRDEFREVMDLCRPLVLKACPQTSSLSISWKLVKNANYWPHPGFLNQSSGVEFSKGYSNETPGDSDTGAAKVFEPGL